MAAAPALWEAAGRADADEADTDEGEALVSSAAAGSVPRHLKRWRGDGAVSFAQFERPDDWREPSFLECYRYICAAAAQQRAAAARGAAGQRGRTSVRHRRSSASPQASGLQVGQGNALCSPHSCTGGGFSPPHASVYSGGADTNAMLSVINRGAEQRGAPPELERAVTLMHEVGFGLNLDPAHCSEDLLRPDPTVVTREDVVFHVLCRIKEDAAEVSRAVAARDRFALTAELCSAIAVPRRPLVSL
eukprot:TRINITY_DN23393_c0_g1_i1.p1 TRINITY_DN23393_c0_g1~~TRINITY_DN23393_c0_g1_i1.p1  ORF type:complete len:275 (+),score=64.49 TRINITY_DN23393_c0_g1_i1:85-825(+)